MFRIKRIHHHEALYSAWIKLQDWFYRDNEHELTILVILFRYCTRHPDDGSSVIRKM